MLRCRRVFSIVATLMAAAYAAVADPSLSSRLAAEADALRALDTAGPPTVAVLKYEQALPLWRQLGKSSEEAEALHRLGLVRDALGDRHAARDAFQQVLRLKRAIGETRGEAATLTALASVT